MSGIYIHIPFCKQKCSYCDFHFSTQLKNKFILIRAIEKELIMRKNEVTEPIETIYFGGGTPSLLNKYEWNLLFEAIHGNYSLVQNIEITVEVNPDDITTETIALYLGLGVNRLSIGIQSFYDLDLRFMNRVHTGKEAEKSIQLAQNGGIQNLSIDLIYGSPTTNNQMWELNLEKAVSLNIPHISSYALTVEQKTALFSQIKTKKIKPLDEEKALFQFKMLQEILKKNHFIQYEISNFSKLGFESIHNRNYWKNKAYLGIGPSAHSYDGKNTRSWNVSNNTKYIKSLEQNILPSEKEILSESNKFNETLMTGLRTKNGINLDDIGSNFDKKYTKHLTKETHDFINKEIILIQDNHISISPKHYFLADGIISKLFFT